MLRKEIIDTERATPAENARRFLVTVSAEFTVGMLFYLAFTSAFAAQGAQMELRVCWSMLALFVAATALQLVFFTPTFIKRMSYPVRLALFGVGLYVALAIAAVTMNWFPVEYVSAWVIFDITYLAMLAAATAIAHRKAKRDYRALNEKLAEYRNGSNQR